MTILSNSSFKNLPPPAGNATVSLSKRSLVRWTTGHNQHSPTIMNSGDLDSPEGNRTTQTVPSKPDQLSKRSVSLPVDLGEVEKSSRKLFWFIFPSKSTKNPRSTLCNSKKDDGNERLPDSDLLKVTSQWATSKSVSLQVMDNKTQSDDDSECAGLGEEEKIELLGLDFLQCNSDFPMMVEMGGI
ncbi:hypothetical protein IV203_001909 [Nitzschia inconspicua]|uniref:Uncharacterized protein n=1 Tax=Nitzschia inconspicua TaxID=303405 RepID=A0A9K3PRY8_9STRA|nr:hypothetical protein IV203_001909 [Nitzschia inconspicua]